MKKILAIIAMAGIMSSCNDALEISPNDSILEQDAYETVGDLQLGLNGVYRSYSPENIIDFSSNFSDDTRIGADNGGQNINIHNQVLNGGTGQASAIWTGNYGLINNINRLLTAASNIEPLAGEQADYDRITGSCYALRALAHFELVQFFSTSYEASAEGVPYVDYVGVFEQPARETVGENFASIKEDLNIAEGLISPTLNDNGYVTQDFITALRARIALYEGDNNGAIAYSQELIDAYPLANQSQYLAMFMDDSDNTEVIFKQYRINANDVRVGGLWYFTGTDGAFMEMSYGLASILPTNDVRTYVLLDTENVADIENDPLLINKYPGKLGFAYLNDLKIFRVSEMYLINAEAKAKEELFAEAANMVQTLRNARLATSISAPAYEDINEAIDDILAERRLELAYEGHRYLDIKRTRSITQTGIVRNSSDCGGATPCELSANDYRFTLPIPNVEMNGNQNMTQNPGY